MSGLASLKHHLEWIEQDQLEVSEKLFGNNVMEKDAYEKFMKDYSEGVHEYLKRLDNDGVDLDAKVVLISSVVTVESAQDGERMDFKIVSPNDTEMLGEFNTASYLSPIGKSMLLKAVNECVEVTMPHGVDKYKIIAIKQHMDSSIYKKYQGLK